VPLAGGIMQHGYQCGMTWGATLAAGAQAHRLFGPGPFAETMAIHGAGRLVETFRALAGDENCLSLTGLDRSSSTLKMMVFFILTGGTVRCFRKAVKFARAALSEIDTVLSEKEIEAPSPPVSCAAMVAKKTGMSDLHTTMAAGLAGGIGLSGGGCGALGAALWILGMKTIEKGDVKFDFASPAGLELIEGFLEHSDKKFLCSEISGRKFESVDDHALYLRDGGCSKIIEALVAQGSAG